MNYYGYMGKILYVDLSSGDIREEELDIDLARKYIGDFGLGARLIYDLLKPGIDSLSPENPIVIGAGPLCGTSYPGTARCNVWTKFPLSNGIGHGVGGLGFASGLKYAGYDQLVITGRADNPVYLKISDDDVEICDAKDLWGKDIYEATDEVWRKHGTGCGVMCIGQAGENLVKISLTLIDKSSTIGRNGFAAVMGSKNLKLIITGGRKKVRVYDQKRFGEMTDDMMSSVMNQPGRDKTLKFGKFSAIFDLMTRSAPKNYYSEIITDPLAIRAIREKFGPERHVERVKKARLACLSCPKACKNVDEIKHGEYKGQVIFASHPMFSPGTAFRFENLEESIRCAQLLQRYGIDLFSLIRSVEFLLDLYKRGIVSKDDLEGLDLLTEKAVSEFIEKTAFRRGIGDAVADGIPGIVSRFGQECEKYCSCIKGADPYWDARTGGRLGIRQLGLAVIPQPRVPTSAEVEPDKLRVDGKKMPFRKFGELIGMPQHSLDRVFDSDDKINVARYLPYSEDFFSVDTCLGFCFGLHIRQFVSMEKMAELYSAVTGIEIDGSELRIAGERAWNLFKVLNVREGFSRKDDKFPSKWFEPLKAGDKEIFLKDMYQTKILTPEDTEILLDDYYDERGWDIQKGIPTRKKLEEIGLREIADDLANRDMLP